MKKVDFENGRVGHNIAMVALPMMAAQVLSLLYNIVDRIYIGRIPETGKLELGSIGLCFPVITLILAFTNLYGAGGSPLFSMALGAGDKKKADTILSTAFSLLVSTAVILTVIFEIVAEPMLYMFGASSDMMVYALPYLRIYLIGTLFAMIATGMNPFINAQGYSSYGMRTVMIGAFLNILLDPVFIFVLGMGVSGAAVATVISQFFSAAFVISFLTGKRADFGVSKDVFNKFNKKEATRITALGISSFVMQFTNSLVAVVCNNVLNTYGGDIYVSVYTVISSVRQILDVPIGAISDGSSPVLSYNYGAKRYDRVIKAIRLSIIAGTTYTFCMWIFILIFPHLLVHIFTPDKELMPLAVTGLRLYFAAFVFQSLQYGGQSVFKSLGMNRKAIFFSLFRKVVLVVPLTLLLPYIVNPSVNGVYLAEPISNIIGGMAAFTTMIFTVYIPCRRKAAEASK